MRKKLVNSLIAGTMAGILCVTPVLAEEGITGDVQTDEVSVEGADAAEVSIDATNFPDENFRSYVSDEFDSNKDGKLSGEEIGDVNIIYVSESGIESLKGIEYFSALTYLDCSYNQLSNLDVSQNIALTELECQENQLSSLDVSKNTVLDRLVCKSNQLTDLDVSKNTALVYLNCDDNQLTSLDVSKNTALVYLFCSQNQLTSLDVSKNTALEPLGCSDNQLTSLDVSQNTALVVLYCPHNQLTDLDVSQNTALRYLACDGNQLTSLDISNCKNLIEKCQKGSVIEDPKDDSIISYIYDDYFALICDKNVTLIPAIQTNPNPNPTVSGNDIEKGDVAIDVEHFPDETFRNYVSKNFDNDEDGKLSGEEIGNVNEMDVSGLGIGSLKGIEYFSKLAALYCRSNQLTSLDVSQNAALITLYCQDNHLTSLDVSKNTALINMDCDFNQLTGLDVSKNTALERLSCILNRLTSLDVSKNTALTKLECSVNQLTDLDVSNNTALKEFYCASNQLTSLDLSKNTALEALNCRSNQLTSVDVSKNTALTGLYCDDNQLSSLDVSGATALERLSCERNPLTKLDISKCRKLLEILPTLNKKIEDSVVYYYEVEHGYEEHVFSYDENVIVIDRSEDTIDPAPVPTPTPKPGSTPTLGASQASTGTQGSAPVVKKANTVKVTVKTPSVKAKNKKQTISASKIFKVSKAQGKVSYKKLSGSKNLTISKTGKITVKKGTKVGTYKIKVAITAAGNENYKAKTVNKTVKVKVKK